MNIDHDFVARRTTDVTLPDGTRIRLRPILPDDKDVLLSGFERLSPESRYRRFMTAIDRLTPEQLRYLTELDYVDHFAWVAFAPREPGAPGIGVARYVRLRDEPEIAEAAVTVTDDYHGRGVGTLLLEALAAAAVENGIKKFRYYVLAENRPMLEILRNLGAHVEVDEPGVLRGDLDVPASLEAVKDGPLYRTLRAAARGEIPVLGRPIVDA